MDAVHSIDELLASIEALQASDLHIAAGSRPLVRVNGVLGPLEDTPELTGAETQPLLYRILTTEQQKRLEVERQIDISYAISGIGRFRVNVFFQRGAVGAAFRLIPHKIKTLEELGHPPVLRKLTELPRGLVLVTGPTGSGKSTTLAAMIDEINRNRDGPHPHDRGPDRVRPPATEVPGEPARGRRRHARRSRRRCGAPCARTPT